MNEAHANSTTTNSIHQSYNNAINKDCLDILVKKEGNEEDSEIAGSITENIAGIDSVYFMFDVKQEEMTDSDE